MKATLHNITECNKIVTKQFLSVLGRPPVLPSRAAFPGVTLVAPSRSRRKSVQQVLVQICEQSSDRCAVLGGAAAKLLEQAQLIVWDEAPAVHRWHLRALDNNLRDLADNDLSEVRPS